MAERANILFILTDQMRGDCLSSLGHPVVRTPNLDNLAGKGTIFTAAYSPCPSCIAARASIFTGLSPSSAGRIGYDDCVPWEYDDMLAEVLAAAGYQTHCVGKTHFFPQGARFGFESIESYEGDQNFDGTFINDYYEWLREQSDGKLTEQCSDRQFNSWLARPSSLPEELHNNSWVATPEYFLRRRDTARPFFLNLSFHRPHAPLDPPQAYWEMYRDCEIPPVAVGEWAAAKDLPVTELDAWRGRLPKDVLADSRRAYYAQIAHIDSQIGRVLETLEELRVGPTWIIFTSDHGEMLGDHHLFRKCYAYEGSAKVPLIVSPPASGRGDICNAPVVLQDIYPTILAVASAEIPDRTEGLSLLPFVAGSASGRHVRPFVHGEHLACYHPDLGMQFLTDGRWKYVWYTSTGQEQLFDLENDPAELEDLSANAAWKDTLQTWRGPLVKLLATRPQDGLSDGKKLLAGKSGKTPG